MSMARVKILKELLGIPEANCRSCCHMTYESEGDYGEYTWNECSKKPAMSHLRSFPFRKDMKCWEPCYWSSKFVDQNNIYNWDDKDYDEKIKQFRKIVETYDE